MRKTLALLAYLSLSPQSIPRETLATMFWPEYDQQHSLTNLRRNLFSLARSLPPGLLETDRERVGLRREAWLHIDVEEFYEQLSAVKEHSHRKTRDGIQYVVPYKNTIEYKIEPSEVLLGGKAYQTVEYYDFFNLYPTRLYKVKIRYSGTDNPPVIA
jgi:hypothetical protein